MESRGKKKSGVCWSLWAFTLSVTDILWTLTNNRTHDGGWPTLVGRAPTEIGLSHHSMKNQKLGQYSISNEKRVEGIRICCSGRLEGAEIARTEWEARNGLQWCGVFYLFRFLNKSKNLMDQTHPWLLWTISLLRTVLALGINIPSTALGASSSRGSGISVTVRVYPSLAPAGRDFLVSKKVRSFLFVFSFTACSSLAVCRTSCGSLSAVVKGRSISV